jgi:hypothetical protein
MAKLVVLILNNLLFRSLFHFYHTLVPFNLYPNFLDVHADSSFVPLSYTRLIIIEQMCSSDDAAIKHFTTTLVPEHENAARLAHETISNPLPSVKYYDIL